MTTEFNAIDNLNDHIDILHIIMSRLPAKAFAFAACVCRPWNHACKIVLLKPKLAWAVSMKPKLEDAAEEAVETILSHTIRPQFVIACFTYYSSANHDLIQKRFGPTVPIITSCVGGAVGHSEESEESFVVESADCDVEEDYGNTGEDSRRLCFLIVGWIPDMKVDAIPLTRPYPSTKEENALIDDNFIDKIKRFSMSASGLPCPSAIILFGDNWKLISKLDAAFANETAIVGNLANQGFFFQSVDDDYPHDQLNYYVALTFARDKDKPVGVGETQFHLPLMNSVSSIGTSAYFVSAIWKDPPAVDEEVDDTGYNVVVQNQDHVISGIQIINAADEVDKWAPFNDLYAGFEQSASSNIGKTSKFASSKATMSLHAVNKSATKSYTRQKYHNTLVVCGGGIKMGDTFSLFQPDMDPKALLTHEILSPFSHCQNNRTSIFGGMLFYGIDYDVSCVKEYVDNMYRSSFFEKYPHAPLAGLSSELVAKNQSVAWAWKDDIYHVSSFHHSYAGSTLLIMSHTPAD